MAVKTNGKRNRRAGHNLERIVVDLFKAAGFPNVVTTRSESKRRDDQGIDIMNKDESTNGRLPYNIQCKNSTERPKYDTLLSEMPADAGVKNVIIHKYTLKQGTLFRPRGHYAILPLTAFMDMVAELERLRRQSDQLLNNDQSNRRG